MGTLTSLLDLSFSALQADQSAINVTSDNVANQNTTGYTREAVYFQAGDAVTLTGNAASGVNTGNGPISQRDRVLEQRVQQQTQAQAQSSVSESVWQKVQNIFGLSSTAVSASTTAIESASNSFFSSLSLLTSNSSDSSIRQGVLSSANILASAFNAASDQIGKISSGLDQQAANIVTQINSLTATIASLNGEISSLSPGRDAGTLEDQRQTAIAQLSTYVGLDQLKTEGNGITLATSTGSVLVGGNESYPVSTAVISGTTHIFAGSGGGVDLTGSLTGGQLGGVLTGRDHDLPCVAQALDTLAYGIATKLNQQNALGLDGYGNPGLALFTISPGVSGAAATIAVATADPLSVAASAVGEGTTGNTNAQALAGLSTANIVSGTTASSFYASLLSQIGSATSAATSTNSVQQVMLTQLTTQRDSLSAVSLDQEAANLTQYQRSYQAAAKVFSVVDSIMASALNLGVQTSVS